MRRSGNKLLRFVLIVFFVAPLGCNRAAKYMNPFQDPPTAEATLGNKNDHALNGDHNKVDGAREALNAMSTYQRAQFPQPVNPVIKPAIVRLMWIPDHLNTHGDLVPEHYYYLKVKSDQWAVEDAFDLQTQLGTGGAGSAVPFVMSNDSKR